MYSGEILVGPKYSAGLSIETQPAPYTSAPLTLSSEVLRASLRSKSIALSLQTGSLPSLASLTPRQSYHSRSKPARRAPPLWTRRAATMGVGAWDTAEMSCNPGLCATLTSYPLRFFGQVVDSPTRGTNAHLPYPPAAPRAVAVAIPSSSTGVRPIALSAGAASLSLSSQPHRFPVFDACTYSCRCPGEQAKRVREVKYKRLEILSAQEGRTWDGAGWAGAGL
ncbi:hypothetical protein C8R45DRAFT_934749 [Mycena sanguinolenta]|nr:hypothetical protein C8R45DRAFT_934749 [Mycena sanguinolenta]